MDYCLQARFAEPKDLKYYLSQLDGFQITQAFHTTGGLSDRSKFDISFDSYHLYAKPTERTNLAALESDMDFCGIQAYSASSLLPDQNEGILKLIVPFRENILVIARHSLSFYSSNFYFNSAPQEKTEIGGLEIYFSSPEFQNPFFRSKRGHDVSCLVGIADEAAR